MNDADRDELRRAKAILQNPGLAVKLASYAGRPVEWAMARLPAHAGEIVTASTRAALEKALALALHTLDRGARGPPRNWSHRITVWATGAAGGAFGLVGLPIELPVTTTVILRSIADHARSRGEDLSSPEVRVNCLLVLALGGPSASDDGADAGYFAVRAALARAVSDATEYLAGRLAVAQTADRAAPALVRLLGGVAARFGVAVQDKLAAQVMPVVGALGGAAINGLFIHHFQEMAWGHFTVRHLERTYGRDEVHAEYERL